MDSEVLEFLQHSNYIENESSGQAFDDAVEAWEYLMSKPTLNKGRILHTHKLLMQSRDIPEELKGSFRKPLGNLTGNVRVRGKAKFPWGMVPSLMSDWLASAKDIQTEDDIKHLHVVFENIHPFIDGNGRIGRILLNWQRVKLGLPILVIKEEEKGLYYNWFN